MPVMGESVITICKVTVLLAGLQAYGCPFAMGQLMETSDWQVQKYLYGTSYESIDEWIFLVGNRFK